MALTSLRFFFCCLTLTVTHCKRSDASLCCCSAAASAAVCRWLTNCICQCFCAQRSTLLFFFCSCLPARSLMSHLSIFAWIITENRTHSLPPSLSLSLTLSSVPRNVTKVAVSADATERVIFNEGLKFKRVLLRRKRSFSAQSLILILFFFYRFCHERTRSGNVGKAIKMKQRQMQRDCTARKLLLNVYIYKFGHVIDN